MRIGTKKQKHGTKYEKKEKHKNTYDSCRHCHLIQNIHTRAFGENK